MTSNPFKKIFTGMNSSEFSQGFRPYALKMEAHSMPPIVINVFKYYYYLLSSGSTGKMPESEITPVTERDLKNYADLSKYENKGKEALSKAVIIKLNGGLGTSMGLKRAKSLLPAKDGMSFLEIILNQVEKLRQRTDCAVPLVLMNSFNTHADTMMHLNGFENEGTDVPLAFLQHKYPKVLQKDLSPAKWPNNPELEWNPAGHGDIYTSLVTSGVLEKLLRNGFKYAFISNVDNLGAVMDERLLGYMASHELPFVMEVAERKESDKKGGHLAKNSSGRMVLREIAQCPDEDLGSFCDITKHRFFNTNSLWIDLEVLEQVFVYNRMMPLDLIVNPKPLDPRNSSTPPVYQIETAMGSAISAFYDATAVRVPRTRFSPVKTCGDLITVMSDCYVMTDEYTVEVNPFRSFPLPRVQLDPRFYKRIDDFQDRFPLDVPSMLHCRSLVVEGDVTFGPDVKFEGDVAVSNGADARLVCTADMLKSCDFQVVVRPESKKQSTSESEETAAA